VYAGGGEAVAVARSSGPWAPSGSSASQGAPYPVPRDDRSVVPSPFLIGPRFITDRVLHAEVKVIGEDTLHKPREFGRLAVKILAEGAAITREKPHHTFEADGEINVLPAGEKPKANAGF